ncbi:MAG: hypothetical protein V3U84_04830 [Thiotrichaceae bacterium]
MDLLCQLNDMLHRLLDTFGLKLNIKTSLGTTLGLTGGFLSCHYIVQKAGRNYEEGLRDGREEIIRAAEKWVKNKKSNYPYQSKDKVEK